MRNKLEHFLLVSLLAISIILGLSFWLNTIFNFNIFCQDHWNELARLQASHTPVDMGFYISIIIALLLFLACTYIIYFPLNKQKNLKPEKTNVEQTSNKISPKQKDTKEEKSIEDPIPVPHTMVSRPPRLKLPTNMAEIAAQRQKQMTSQPKVVAPEQNPYTNMLSQIFSENGYVVKPNPKISGFTPNLFAIGTEEAVWIGAVDVDANKMIDAVKRLDSVFQETLDDIQININAFMLDTMDKYQSNDSLQIFKNIDEIKAFISEHPNGKIDDKHHEDFDAYSEYIDTIIQYVKNI